jgi:fructose/tagatose bisphosphate aldolase
LGSVEDAVKLIEETGADSLAVGLGNAHGFYKGKPKLDFQRLAEVNEALDTPLVLHGGTGIPPEDIMQAIKNGINKVNVGTELHYVYLKQLAGHLDPRDIHPNIIEVMETVVQAVKEPVKRWIRICMANGKA